MTNAPTSTTPPTMAAQFVPTRGFYLGLAIGQFWLTLIGALFSSLIWVLGQTTAQVAALLGGVGLVTAILFGADILLLRAARRLPRAQTAAEAARRRRDGRTFGLRFGVVVLIEVIIIGALDIALAQTGHGAWVIPVTFFIVGLHFIPLAFVFHVRPYVVLGVLWVAITVGVVIFVPSTQIAGQGIAAWVVYPIVGCAISTWPVVAYIVATSLLRLHAAQR